jgi:hypothetical protein
MLRKGIHRIVSVTMFLFLSNKLSRTVGPNSRLWVQAFSTTNGAFSYPKTKTSSTINNNNNGLTCPSSTFVFEDDYRSKRNGKCYSTTTNLFDSSGVVEQDLDSALDDLLAGTFDVDDDDADDNVDEVQDVVKASKPKPSTIIEEVSILFVTTTATDIIHSNIQLLLFVPNLICATQIFF